ncbi:MAG: alpha/beta hydrolase [Chloroflexota bacterium]
MIHTQVIDGRPMLAVDSTGKGELVLFLHGIGGGRSNWRGQLTALASICHAVALDFRGYGDSELGAAPVTVEAQMRDIQRVMAAFETKQVHLVGLSYGSWLAACFAHLHPQQVASLTCCAGSTGMSEASDEEIDRFTKLRLRPMEAGQTPADIAESVISFISGPNSTAATRMEMVASMSAIPRTTYIAALRCFLNPPFKINFEAFRFPTRFIAGEHDKLAPPDKMEMVAKRVPHARFSVIAGAGHLVNLEQSAAFNQLLQEDAREWRATT